MKQATQTLTEDTKTKRFKKNTIFNQKSWDVD